MEIREVLQVLSCIMAFISFGLGVTLTGLSTTNFHQSDKREEITFSKSNSIITGVLLVVSLVTTHFYVMEHGYLFDTISIGNKIWVNIGIYSAPLAFTVFMGMLVRVGIEWMRKTIKVTKVVIKEKEIEQN